MKSIYSHRESGIALPFVMMMLIAILAAGGYSIDLGMSWVEQRQLQSALDSASLAAASLVGESGTTDAAVLQRAADFAAQNGGSQSEFSTFNCGIWNAGAFTACQNGCGNGNGNGGSSCCSSCADSNTNAVRIFGQRQVATTLSGIVGISSLLPGATSISLKQSNENFNCIKPFGIWENFFYDEQGNPKQTNFQLTIGNQNPGNWGKLDIGGDINSSSGTQFEDAMINGACSAEYEVGEMVDPGTGFGGSISNVFDALVEHGAHLDMYFAVTSQFGNGQSPVELLGFAKVDFMGQHGNGNNWTGDFLVKEFPTTPPTMSTGSSLPAILVQ